MEDKKYLYDAFISYRHLPLDKAVAARLQELLEGYRPPKGGSHSERLKRIFRDQSELPTSGDLGAHIHEALMQSRYLIVVCSEKTKESAWCMEEIRQFKEAHHGRNDRILAVLVEGEPRKAFPEQLLHETVPFTHEDGRVTWKERALEPLSADVRAKSIKGSIKLLKTEFLRVAAPLLDCRFDELYRRHERRRKKRLALTAGSGVAVLTCVLAVVGTFAWRTYLSEKNYRMALADSYTRQGTEYMEEGELQEALLYCAQALTLEPGSQTAARVSAALLLEKNRWPYLVREEAGAIIGKQVVKGQELSGLETAAGMDGEIFLRSTLKGYEIWQSGQRLEALPAQLGAFTGASPDGEYWTFCGEEAITFYHVETGEESRIPRPREINASCDFDLTYTPLPAAYRLPEKKAIAAYGGYVYLYEEKNGSFTETARVDLANVFPEAARQNFLAVEDFLWVSDDGGLAIVADGSGIAVFDTADLMLTAAFYRYHYLLNDVEIREDGQAFALVFGNSYGISNSSPGGYLEVMDRNGNTLFKTEVDWKTPLEGAAFSASDPGKIWAWGRNVLNFYDMDEGTEFAVPLKAQRIEGASFDEEAYCVVDHGDGKLGYYGLAEFSSLSLQENPEQNAEPEENRQAKEITIDGMQQAVQLKDNLLAARKSLSVFLLDETGAELDKAALDYPVNEMRYSVRGSQLYLYQKRSTYLFAVKIDEKNRKFSGLSTMDTRGSLITSLYEGENGLMAVTGTNQVLLYPYGQTSPALTIQLRHSGVVQGIREVGNGCIAVEMKLTESNPDSTHFETNTLTELWDMKAKVYISCLEREADAGTGLSLPPPDEAAAAFLVSLTCSAFDDTGNIIEKEPTLLTEALGNWGSGLRLKQILKDENPYAGTEEDNRETDAELCRLGTLYEQYKAGPEYGQEEVWFKACDDIWERLRQKEIVFANSELDLWFSMYQRQAHALGRLDQIGTGVQIYLELSIDQVLLKKASDGLYYDYYLTELMTATGQYDDVIADGFARLAAGLTENARTDDALYIEEIYTAYWLDLYAGLLRGEGNEAFEEFVTAKETGSFKSINTAEMDALLALCSAQPDKAAEIKANEFEYERIIGMDDKEIVYYDRLYLAQYYVLEKRGILSRETMNEYLSLIPMDVGIRVTELSPEAQNAGLKLGDLIIAVNGTYIYGLQHATDLFGEEAEPTLKLIRNGQIVYLDKKEPIPFIGSFDLVLKK